MIPPLDPFAQKFDSIDVDATRSPAAAAFDRAMEIVAPRAAAFETPGFYLLDDAGGRFIVDRDFGVVSLVDETLIVTERGQVHRVQLKVVEASGATYDMEMRLRVTGRVPQMVGAEEFAYLAELTAGPIPDLKPASRIALVQDAPAQLSVAWSTFAAAAHKGAARSISACGAAPYGALLSASLPAADAVTIALNLGETTPAPSTKSATWSI